MRHNRAGKDQKTSASKAQKQTEKQSPGEETMSQRQNRQGKGRQQNGSDGGTNMAGGSNH